MRITGELVLLVLAAVFVVNALVVGLPLWWLAFAGGERVQRRSSIQAPAGDVT